jgi:hypothetical protein
VDLGPLEQYSDEYTPVERLRELRPSVDPAATGPRSQTVRGIICGGCSGWAEKPTSEDVYEALRAEQRTAAQRNAIGVLTKEADDDEVMHAHLEGAFTWRQLARAYREIPGGPPSRAAFLLKFRRRPER